MLFYWGEHSLYLSGEGGAAKLGVCLVNKRSWCKSPPSENYVFKEHSFNHSVAFFAETQYSHLVECLAEERVLYVWRLAWGFLCRVDTSSMRGCWAHDWRQLMEQVREIWIQNQRRSPVHFHESWHAKLKPPGCKSRIFCTASTFVWHIETFAGQVANG